MRLKGTFLTHQIKGHMFVNNYYGEMIGFMKVTYTCRRHMNLQNFYRQLKEPILDTLWARSCFISLRISVDSRNTFLSFFSFLEWCFSFIFFHSFYLQSLKYLKKSWSKCPKTWNRHLWCRCFSILEPFSIPLFHGKLPYICTLVPYYLV